MILIYVLDYLMDLKIDDLRTFIEINKAGTFTKAAKLLGLSQSALSQKVARLEESIHSNVFIRNPRSLELTASGEKLLVYAKQMTLMQEDFLSTFDQYDKEISGVIRVAGFSSVMRSLIIPSFKKIIVDHPRISIEFSTHEMNELEVVLSSSRADIIITDYYPQKANTDELKLGDEEYVEIRSKKRNSSEIYLDHGSHDNATKSFFEFQGINKNYTRKFMGDVYSIIDGVALGFGNAIMSKHLIEKDKRFMINKHKKRYFRPIVASRLKQSYYSPLQEKVFEVIKKNTN